MKSVLFLAVFIFNFAGSSIYAQVAPDANQDCSSKTCFPKQVAIAGMNASLLGTKLFRYYFWTAYSIALYGPPNARTPEKILADVSKKLVLEYRRDFEAKDIIDAADKLLKNNPNVDLAKIQSALNEINQLYVSVKEGDRYSLEYAPGKGTSLILNDRFLGTVGDAEFARAYFGIWLSEFPLDKSLRDDLLGDEEESKQVACARCILGKIV